MKLSDAQIALMREVLADRPPPVVEAADRLGRGEVISDEDADTLVEALTAAMLSEKGYDAHELTARDDTLTQSSASPNRCRKPSTTRRTPRGTFAHADQ